MKKLALCILSCAVILLASCASAPKVSNLSSMAEIAPGSLPADRYIVLGEVSGETTFVVKSEDLAKEYKNAHSSEPTAFVPVIPADKGDYGFIGKSVSSDLSILERATASAEYKLIELARYNKADAVICVNRDIEVEDNTKNTMITVKVTGLAVRIKADEGYSIEYPEPEDVWDSSAYDLDEDEEEGYTEDYE